jgi:hypothetical protein
MREKFRCHSISHEYLVDGVDVPVKLSIRVEKCAALCKITGEWITTATSSLQYRASENEPDQVRGRYKYVLIDIMDSKKWQNLKFNSIGR